MTSVVFEVNGSDEETFALPSPVGVDFATSIIAAVAETIARNLDVPLEYVTVRFVPIVPVKEARGK